jgi:endonuclease/exonuclease/phosphatase family metal-dependent hydrolase
MSEIRVASFNALNALGDRERMADAVELLRRLDADVMAVPETAVRNDFGMPEDTECLLEAINLLEAEGYQGSETNYSPHTGVRDAHFMSVWTRVGGLSESDGASHIGTFGQRHGFKLTLSDMDLAVYGLHLDDRFPEQRVASAEAVCADFRNSNVAGAVVMGDLNDMYPSGTKMRLVRAAGRLANMIDVQDMYDETKKMQRLAGKVLRLGGMAEGKALDVFWNNAFYDADPLFQPTIGTAPAAFQVDHILASAAVVNLTDFKVHPRSIYPDSRPVSDHSPISATVRI